jgi:phage-related protein
MRTENKIKQLQASLTRLGLATERFKSVWISALRPFVELWGKVAAVVVDGATQIGVFINKLNQVNPAITQMAGMFLYLFSMITLILSPMAIGIGRADGMRAAFTFLFNSMKPLILGFLRIAGIASVVSGVLVILGGILIKLWKNSEVFRTSIVQGWQAIKNTVATAVQPLIPSLQQLGLALVSLLNAFTGGGNTMQSFWQGLGDAVGRAIQFISSIAIPLLSQSLQGIFSTLKIFVDGLKVAFSQAAVFIQGVFSILNGNAAQGQNLLQLLGLSPETVTLISTIALQLKTGLIAAFQFIQSIAPQVGQIVVSAFQLIQQVIMAVIPIIVPIIQTGFTIIKTVMTVLWPIVVSIIRGAWENIKNIVRSALNIIQNVIQLFSNLLKGNWSGAWANLKAIVKNALGRVW